MSESIPAKTIVTRSKSTAWFGAEYNMNLYRGCSHGCIYCDSRSDCYKNPDFDRVRHKENALAIVRDDLRRLSGRLGVVATGAMSDPYNPREAELLLTRHALELLAAYGFGVAIDTKSPLVTRDLDLLGELSQAAPVLVKFTVTTCDDDLCRKVEPYVASASQRLAALSELAKANIFTGVLMMPVLPFLEDEPAQVLEVARRAADAGARFVYPAFGMTMRAGQREHFYRELEARFPGQGLARRYAQRYGNRYQCSSPRARALWDAFTAECDRLGLLYHMKDIVSASRLGYAQQLTLF